uniref:RNA-directed RNA polymerase L n=1 Tax=Vesicular stomatitis Indiana virus (strain 85CLB South America) TaxID=434490 RepID=L_VSIVS|nr:RecName: Full=RNA-directed RNA polymerase L; Short=Protein L; AltName: Full=Large structural protein; AltName: Full=Replicase; AltName: Full=Transcriptase; Includes: RecName: Full=RNA-directed RNA polymerase; Includes: RecName: Full=GTP phosphohydrolase; Includes: RecName: Full=GDP polyribonucleotidyltransferase; AltName: Full=PRNTase; Includes: RecName: Full=mRNA cap methyltransferase; AltName: Full=mRNA (guanine-N(7)-)-methyltransferase; Short=G-N7-MTase; AltName: Full=mRNA (nucleoside-2'-O-)-
MEVHDFETEESNDFNEDDYATREFLNPDERMTYLNHADYNLNSPLISDDIDNLIRKFNSLPIPSMWDSKKWDGVLEMLTACQANPIPTSQMHKWMGSWLMSDNHDASQGYSFLHEVDKEAEITFDVVETFIRGWGNKQIEYIKKEKWTDSFKILAYLCQKFLDLHKLTLILNAVSEVELLNLARTFKGKVRKSSHGTNICRLRVPSLGPTFISEGWAYFKKLDILMDRNFLLMVKDVIIGRMQTVLSMVCRIDNLFSEQDIFSLLNIYRIGDKIVERQGNFSYDLIKMVEPICNLKLMKLARESRPLVPQFPHFENHIKTSVDEGAKIDRGIKFLHDQIMSVKTVDLTLVIYGSFRHWGHPFIDYYAGLEKLHSQVTMKKDIDVSYAKALASDLARIVLFQQFNDHKKWFVNGDLLPHDHPFKSHVKENTWPTAAQVQDFGDKWHELPLIKCFEIPDLLDPSIIYSDKSHSMNRSEVLKHVRTNPNTPIPSKKVLQTMLDTKATNWKEFLKEIDEKGLDDDDLIIGLKGKERELKLAGRFFSLMSWKLREYFVITEYLIKTHFVPMFKGLTMADDLTAVIKKMLDSSSGQGLKSYEAICIANHIDYEKWNNHQRKLSNGPVFRVMGQFLGYPSLIERTHEFFEKSLIYYNGRPDLMRVHNNTLVNSTSQRVCWQGQEGGLEGLRQKGWSILNLLVIQREAKIRNTAVKVLAQGDNQVICTQYKTKKSRNVVELQGALNQMVSNNEKIMTAIKIGTGKLGLLINDDETMQSADYLNYGKIPIFRGVIRGLETKRWSRVTCVTNDQIPTCANIMSSVSTNALTVAHFAENPINAMIQYNYFGTFARLLLMMHDPALRQSLYEVQDKIPGLHSSTFKYAMLYLDPSIGGVSGMSLSRFLIRAFPDPVTESLSFWRFIHVHARSEHLKEMSAVFGNPEIAKFRITHIDKLVEDPTSLNIAMGMSPANLLKTEVKKCLIESRQTIKNQVIKDATIYLYHEEDRLRSFLWSINPLFPRFLSEFKSGTFLGVADGLISLFQNSRTIRNSFKKKYHRELDDLIVRSEVSSLTHLGKLHLRRGSCKMWTCSATHADTLRYKSWGRTVIGTTVPHPLEMLGPQHRKETPCAPCNTSGFNYVSVHCPDGIHDVFSSRGPLPAYLGSKTSESTSILQPWERESKVPLIKRATRLRDAISWFVEPDSKLAITILSNIHSLTGEEWTKRQHGFKRTGSALHRFSTSRMSHGGFASQSTAALTRLMATTDTMSDLGDQNFDFLFQATLLYAQITTTVARDGWTTSCTDHYHITCKSCLRPIEEITLDSNMDYTPPDVSHVLKTWRNGEGSWGQEIKQIYPLEGNWKNLAPAEQSYQVGRCIGFLYGDLAYRKSNHAEDSSLFPLSIQSRIRGRGFLKGLLDGLMRASCCQVIHRRSLAHLKRPANAVYGGLIYLIDKLSVSPPFLSLTRSGPIRDELETIPHKIPTSYPTSNRDMGVIVRNYFKYQCRLIEKGKYRSHYSQLWLFSDVLSIDFLGPFSISTTLLQILYKPSLSGKDKNELRELANLSSLLRSGEGWEDIHVKFFTKDILLCPEEIRHACKFGIAKDNNKDMSYPPWGRESRGTITTIPVYYTTTPYPKMLEVPPRIQNPLLSGIRLGQLPTGAHYKIRSILHGMGIHYRDFLSCGDGSGGMTAALLRENVHSRGIFNSLLELSGSVMRGASPEPPSALETLGGDRSRCVNGETCWEHPSDLCDPRTWDYFLRLKAGLGLQIDLIVMDMEVRDSSTSLKIESNVRNYVHRILDEQGVLIYKTYGTYICESEKNAVTILGPLFKTVDLVQTEFSSSQTSELYMVCKGLKKLIDEPNPDWSSINESWKNLYAFQSSEKEFARAKKVSTYFTLTGIPTQFIPDPFVNLETMLQIFGVPTGVSHAAALKSSDRPADLLTISLFYMAIISYYNINHIRVGPIPPNPPSDGIAQNVGIAITGISFWLSLMEKDIPLYQQCLAVIRQSFPIRWEAVSVKGGYKQKWSTRGDGLPKDTRISDSLAPIGNWIRSLELVRNQVHLNPFNEILFNQLCRTVDNHLKWSNLRKNTGIIEWINRRISKEDRSILILKSDLHEENSWRD